MKYSYFPGCTLKTKAKALEQYAMNSAKALGIELIEQEEWQCCGAVYPLSKDEIATKLSSVRSLAQATQKGEKLVTLCTACHQVIKRVNVDMKQDQQMSRKVNNYLQLDKAYEGEGEVLHFLEVLRDQIGFDELAKKVKKPLTGRKIGAYYGCLLLRPYQVMQFDDPESPSTLEAFIKALGAIPVKYPYRTECCGGYLSVNQKNLAQDMSAKIMDSAQQHELDEVLTACPLCKYNLESVQEKHRGQVRVTYFTELLAEALDVKA